MRGDKVFIIAEAGVNHNGDLRLAERLVDAAVEAGADAVKFQTFKAERVVAATAKRAEYQKKNMPEKDETQFAMLKRLELGFDDFRELKSYCGRRGIVFLSSPFDLESIDFLDELGVPYFKIPSGEITNLPFLRRIGRKRRPIILSTGMSTLGEIEGAVEILRKAGTQELTLLHCTTSYPAPPEEVNLRAMLTLEQAFGLPVGYSDHTIGFAVPVAAAALGASVIEKHLTLDCRMEGPDHKASLEPAEFKSMVEAVRMVEKSLGDGLKKPTMRELEIMPAVRRSITAAMDIRAGERIMEECLTVKRPGTGISPIFWDFLLEREARCDILVDTVLTWEMV